MEPRGSGYRMVAKTFAGLEHVLAKEITDLGGQDVKPTQRAVEFSGDDEVLYKANYLCRSAIRILKPIAEFHAPDENILYEEVKKIPWENFMDLRTTFSVDGTVSHSNITHSKYLALKAKDAIADQFRERTGQRPSVEKFNPGLRINVRIFKNDCIVSIDSSGESLHKRGYRKSTGPAPLNEVLAAGMILLTGWKGKTNFIDPMCGSGTLVIEAAMIAKKIPAGYFRQSWTFQNWRDFDKNLWAKVMAEAKTAIEPIKVTIVGSDRSGRILQVARENISGAGLANDIELRVDFIGEVIPPPGGGVMVTNPPYGERIKTDDINGLYTAIGDNLKQKFAGYSAWIISSHMEATKHIGLKPAVRIPLNNGALACKYLGFEIYEGSKKEKQDHDFKPKHNKTNFRKDRTAGKRPERRQNQ